MTATAGNPENGRRVEQAPDTPGTMRTWAHLLAGPIIFMVHFGAVYLLAETACAADHAPNLSFFGPGTLRVVVVALTVAAAVGTAIAARSSHRRRPQTSGYAAELAAVGFLLALGSLVAILAVGIPALVIDPC